MILRASLFVAFVFISVRAISQLTPYYDETYQKYGYDSASHSVIEPKYSEAYPFRANEALVKQEKYQIIDRKERVIKTFDYDNMRPVTGTQHYSFHTPKSVGYIDSEGKILNEFAIDSMVQWYEDARGYVVYQRGKLGIFSMDQGMVMPTEYECDDFMSTFNYDGYLYFDENSRFALKHNGKWGLMTLNKGPLTKFEYDKLVTYYEEYVGALKGGKWGLLDKTTGKVLAPLEFDYYFGRYKSRSHSGSGNPYIFLKEGKIVLYDVDTKKVVSEVPPSIYEWQCPPYVVIHKDNRAALINTKGNLVIDFKYDFIENEIIVDTVKRTPIFKVSLNGEIGLVDVHNKIIFPMTKCNQMYCSWVQKKPYVIINTGMYFALYDLNHKAITGFEYDAIEVIDDKFQVIKNGKVGTLSVTGKVVWDE